MDGYFPTVGEALTLRFMVQNPNMSGQSAENRKIRARTHARVCVQPSDGRICAVQLPCGQQQQHFAARQLPEWEQLPHNLFLIDANTATPVVAAASFFHQYNPKKITHVGRRYSWMNY